MKKCNKRERKLMRIRNRDRINRNKKQQIVLAPLFILVLIKLGLSNLSAEQVLGRLRFYILMLTDNVNFPVIDPTLIQLEAKADELEDAKADAETGNKLMIEHRNIVQAEAEAMIRTLAWDIQKKAEAVLQKFTARAFRHGTVNHLQWLPARC